MPHAVGEGTVARLLKRFVLVQYLPVYLRAAAAPVVKTAWHPAVKESAVCAVDVDVSSCGLSAKQNCPAVSWTGGVIDSKSR